MNLKRILLSTVLTMSIGLQSISVLAKGEELVAPDPLAERLTKEECYECVPESNKVDGWPEGPYICTESAVVMDMDSGAVLYEKQMNKPQYPASITKFMTALVALENATFDDEVRFTEDSVSFLEAGDAYIGMRPGEVITLKDALHAVLLASANEVSHAVAESVGEDALGGDYNTFIEKMNTRAKEIGCTNSHWVNANGLHDDNHFTTAHDMAVIAAALYRQEGFHEIMSALDYTIPPTNLETESRTFQQNHKMMWKNAMYSYDYCTGGKTGYTDQSGTTLVTVAEHEGRRLAAVVLYDYGADAYVNTRALFDYGFDQFETIPLSGADVSEYIEKFQDPEAKVTVPLGVAFSQLEEGIVLDESNSRMAKVTYTYNKQPVGTFDVELTKEGAKALGGMVLDTEGKPSNPKEEDKEEKPAVSHTMLLVIAAVVIGVLVIIMLVVYKIRQVKRKRAIRARRAREARKAAALKARRQQAMRERRAQEQRAAKEAIRRKHRKR